MPPAKTQRRKGAKVSLIVITHFSLRLCVFAGDFLSACVFFLPSRSLTDNPTTGTTLRGRGALSLWWCLGWRRR